jgi:ABC-2 type transport system ATP-binding protein
MANNKRTNAIPLIEVINLGKTYGNIKAVQNVTFAVMQGEVFGMLGPNGAGKTTTVEIIEGLRTADSGSAKVIGMDVHKEPHRIRSYMGVQLQATNLFPRLTVAEVVDLFASFFPKLARTTDIISLVGLQESSRVQCQALSGGQQQRLSLAIALVNDPDVLFLDEPTTGLDPQARRAIWDVIEAAKQKGKTVFLTTHYMEEAERLCDRVAIIDQGRIIALDSPQTLIHQHFEEQAIEFDAPQKVQATDVE